MSKPETSLTEKKIGYVFKDKNLLRQCLTHATFAYENGVKDNERLELFGDAILGFVVTEFLYKNDFGDEGELTRERQNIVSKEPLLNAFHRLNLKDHVLLGKGLKNNTHDDDKLFSSVYEALVAGIYIDGGMKNAVKFINCTLIKDYTEQKNENFSDTNNANNDWKSCLQEYVQKNKLGEINYRELDRKGPDHRPLFVMAVTVGNRELARGTGHSKKDAENKSAEKALKIIKEQEQKS